MGYSKAGGKLIHEKSQKQKISWHCPFKTIKRKWGRNIVRTEGPADEQERVNINSCVILLIAQTIVILFLLT